MADRFSDFAGGLESPATDGFAVTPNDATELASVTRAVYVGGGGTLAVTLASGAELTFSGLAGGTLLPLRLRRVKATGTSATAIIGLL